MEQKPRTNRIEGTGKLDIQPKKEFKLPIYGFEHYTNYPDPNFTSRVVADKYVPINCIIIKDTPQQLFLLQ